MALQDKNVVRTAADLEKKYNFAKLLGLTKNVERNAAELVKVENELNNMLNSLIINLGDVLDTQSSISLWFYEGIPTTSNEPYTDWTTPSDHYGDFYYDQNSGYVYEFTDLGWVLQDDLNLINAMALTNVELDVSTDHERKVYFQQPTPPYSNGDWWVLEDGTLMICQISKPSGEVYEENDFIVSSLYTATIAVKVNDTLTVLKGTVLEITEDYVKYTDLSTGGSSTIAGDNITTGTIKSNNYVADTSGTKIVLSDGTIDTKNFKVASNGDVTVTGVINASSGTIGGFTLNSNRLYSGSGTSTAGMGVINRDYAFWAGNSDSSAAPFRVGHDGSLRALNCTVGNNLYVGQNQSASAVDSKYIYFDNNQYIWRYLSGSTNGLTINGEKVVHTKAGTSDLEVGSNYIELELNGSNEIYVENGYIQFARQPVISSDKKLKDKIKDIDVSWIDDLKVKEYEYKNNKDKKQIGLIAQDYINKDYAKYFLQKGKEDYYAIQYGNITNALIKYCQELKQEVQELKKEVEVLKNEK